VGPFLVVQLDDMTPIVSIRASCDINGILGMVILFGFAELQRAADSPCSSAVWRRVQTNDCWRSHSGCLMRVFCVGFVCLRILSHAVRRCER